MNGGLCSAEAARGSVGRAPTPSSQRGGTPASQVLGEAEPSGPAASTPPVCPLRPRATRSPDGCGHRPERLLQSMQCVRRRIQKTGAPSRRTHVWTKTIHSDTERHFLREDLGDAFYTAGCQHQTPKVSPPPALGQEVLSKMANPTLPASSSPAHPGGSQPEGQTGKVASHREYGPRASGRGHAACHGLCRRPPLAT
ncbi:unnamed protein product [Rangifer tarandus platyrhynchus]|uniref:Uncharacterized protein n=1 Tax=Rangifer tarandus platyrhynchus TaxID=3082113 RepID=A0ABN8XYF2_RANTA|nr:unnamed protein product [Rangifer tarandus platyrhynchus]